MFHFYWPWMGLLLPLPFLIQKFFPYLEKNKQKTPELNFPSLQRLKDSFPLKTPLKSPSKRWFMTFFWLSWICLVLALMQPEKVDQVLQVKNEGYDLMLAVDVSASMQAVDFSLQNQIISRLDATKNVVSQFVLGRQGDRVGLVIFGEDAYLHVPLTLDTVSVSRMLNDIIAGMAGNATSIGDAIGVSIKALRDRPAGSRVLVLLTDGEDNASSIPPLEAAKLAKQYGIKIYTIGVGKKGTVPFPLPSGGYGMANVTIDEELLKEIADLTEGQYFSATNQKALQSIYEKIDQLEKTESEQTFVLFREPFYYYPLSLSLFFLLILNSYELLTSTRRFGLGSKSAAFL